MTMKTAELLPTVVETAKSICADQPDVPEPDTLKDLDSFSFVQVVLELENVTGYKILEQLEQFDGETFEDLAEFIAELGSEQAASDPSTPA